MRISRVRFFVLALFCLILVAGAVGQNEKFSDPNVEFTFDFPDERWKMTVRPTATKKDAEFVFVDRNDGHLEIRRISSPRTTLIADVIKEEESKLQFMPGYIPGPEENFSGKYRGTVFNFEFVKAGRPMAGRFYFLRVDDSVYILRFTGFRDKLRSIRNQTDIIGRTFEVSRN